jgi:hypothetical protein
MKPDWEVIDPEDRDSLPDEASVVRELRRIRWRRIAGWVLSLGLAAYLAWSFINDRGARDADMRLIAAGDGEILYRATSFACRPAPDLSGRDFQGPRIEAPLEIVARRNGWALTGHRGEPCWLPEWALRRTPLDWNEWRRCGEACEAKAPPGWFAAQMAAMCPRGSVNARCLSPGAVEEWRGRYEAGGTPPSGAETPDGR